MTSHMDLLVEKGFYLETGERRCPLQKEPSPCIPGNCCRDNVSFGWETHTTTYTPEQIKQTQEFFESLKGSKIYDNMQRLNEEWKK